jgi:hypothetical protein
MVRKLVIPLFIVALGALSTVLMAATNQSLHFNVTAPAEASSNDLSVGINATGVPAIQSGPINLTPGNLPELVARTAGQAACVSSFQKIAGCAFTSPAACVGVACCGAFITAGDTTFVFTCTGNGGNGFDMVRIGGESVLRIAARPATSGNITHLFADARTYPDVGVDVASHGVGQVRRNGFTGVVRYRFFVQGNPTPFDANVTVDGTNNDDSEDAAFYGTARTAIQSLAITPPLIVTVRDITTEPVAPWDPFGVFLKQGRKYLTVDNLLEAKIVEMQTLVPTGMSFTVGGAENYVDVPKVPTLSTWGMVILVIMLLFSGYVLMRRQRPGAATT